VQWWFEQEAGIGGEDRMTALVRRIQKHGLTVHVEPATGSKLLRAEPLAAAAEAGNVVLGPDHPDRAWRDRFRGHMADFSATAQHDDIADSASGAFNKLSVPVGRWGTTTWKA
jgi:predicted phage terminase large subunit-like protein